MMELETTLLIVNIIFFIIIIVQSLIVNSLKSTVRKYRAESIKLTNEKIDSLNNQMTDITSRIKKSKGNNNE